MGETYLLDDMLRHAAESGYPLTSHQLKRLRLNGLLDSPSQEHRIGVLGSVSVYSKQALDQLVAVLRLKNDHGHNTFSTLRVAAWLEGLGVEFIRLRRDVVALLRESLEDQQQLPKDREDDVLSRRLRGGLAAEPKRDLSALDQLVRDSTRERFGERVTFEAVALAMLQLVVSTAHADASRDEFDAAVQITNDDEEDVSDLLLEWHLPSTSRWPRVVSRTGAKWFEPGREWLNFHVNLLKRGVFDDLAGTPFTGWIIGELKEQLPNPSAIRLRNLIACNGIVLSRYNADRLLGIFEGKRE